jgi:hypothetical protein
MKHGPWMQAAALALAATATLAIWGCPRTGEPGAGDAAVQPAKESGPAPKIVCDAPEHDFGTVSQGSEVVHTFAIKNTGQGELKIDRARGG